MILSNVLQSLSGTINSIFLGRMIGVNALASVSGFFPVLFFFVSFVIGFGSGGTVLIGQAYGAKDLEKVKAIAGTALSFGTIIGLMVAVFGGLFARPLLIMVGTPENILGSAVEYGRILLIASPLLFLFMLSTFMMRGVGDTVTPLIALVVQIVIGLIATPALIQGWGGLPKLGVTSAAYAGILSWVLTLAMLVVYLRRMRHPMAPDYALLRHFWIDWKILKTVLRIAIPTSLQMVLLSIAEAAVLRFVNGFGSNATAAYGTVNQVVSYIQFPSMSVAMTASIFAAQAIGGGNMGRLRTITRTGIYLSLILTGVLVIVGYLFSRTLIGFFVKDPAVIELAQRLLHITLWSYLVFGCSALVAGVMRASGTVLVPSAISIFSILGIEVPVAYLLSGKIGIEGIWIAYPVAFVAMLAMQTTYYKLVWKKKTIQRLV
ncbi:MAG: MATE family efflux transporter [Rhodospirillaceae bacterium]|nr:MAG: MATE family efflux transporter [Rhodospirillaceae bacterium]